MDNDCCYRALETHDARFDGVFFVGVATTGIYCRPVCPARRPRRENCKFFAGAAAAERAGYRPCRRCRPETAPRYASVDASERLAELAARRIESGYLETGSARGLAAELGVSDRHLRRTVLTRFGVTVIDLAQTQRLLNAVQLLRDTDLPVSEVAFAAGFASVRRFNHLFATRYRLCPTQIRNARSTSPASARLTCILPYRPPMDWMGLLGFLGVRTLDGVERVDGGVYSRTVCIEGRSGYVTVANLAERSAVVADMSADLAPALLPLLRAVKRLFDLGANVGPIHQHLGALAIDSPGMRMPGAFDGFEAAMRAILGQQVTVAVATTIAGRLAAEYGDPVETGVVGLTHAGPTAARLANADPERMGELGVIRSRSRAIICLARAVESGEILLEPGSDPEKTVRQLEALPGIGPWTAHYIAMRCLGWTDAFPHTDLVVRRALGDPGPAAMLSIAERWRPWRAYAVMHLWRGARLPAMPAGPAVSETHKPVEGR